MKDKIAELARHLRTLRAAKRLHPDERIFMKELEEFFRKQPN